MKMKTYLSRCLFFLAAAALWSACKKDALPSNPTLVSPINGLILTVAGVNYTATPQLTEGGTINDTLLLIVNIPSPVAAVEQLTLADPKATCNLAKGDTVYFTNNILSIAVTSGSAVHDYFVEMLFNQPPFMYLIKTSDEDASGNKYFLNTMTAQRLASANYNTNYEGYVDLTATNWDNIGLILSDLATYYDYNGGWYPQQSSGSFTLGPETPSGTGYYPCAGPWADWTWTNANPAIISPGVWKMNYDSTAGELDLVETQWAVAGTASPSTQAMTYDPTAKTWTLTATLSAGDLTFTTIPITPGDPVITYGDLSSSTPTGYLASGGTSINVAVAGSYTLVMNLSAPPYYTYTITKN
jgi:hypothetical protein